MSVTLVQKTGQGGSATGTTAIPAFTASTVGTTLVAVLTSAAGGTAFTQSTGTGWTQRATVANGTTVRAELWTYENNPGGITAAQWTSGTGRVFGEVSEWSGSGTVTLDGTPGTGTAGAAVATLALTNGSSNQAGDAGIVIFANQFSATVAGSSWSAPTGWTALASLNSTSVTSAAVGYYKTGLAAGTLSVTGKYSTATSSTGWAGIVATFKDSAGASLAVTTSSLPGGTVAAPYSQTLAASGGTSPYTWSIASGALPRGLTLSSAGVISGTPTAAATSPFTVKATDSAGATATAALSIVVSAASRVAQLIGFDVARGAWATANATIGPGDTHRMFYTGALPAKFDGDGTPTAVTCIVSYKTQLTQAQANSYVSSIPGARSVILIFHHEPEGDAVFTGGADFVKQFKAESDKIRSAQAARTDNGINIRMAMCAAGYPYHDNGSADVLAGNYLKGLGAVSSVSQQPYADLFTKDIYQGQAGLPVPPATSNWNWSSKGLANTSWWTNWLALVTDPTVVGTVQPLGITEYGVDSEVGNTARYNRIQLDHDYLAANFPGTASSFPLQLWCYWWQSIDVNDAQFTDAATITLWQGFETEAATPLAVTTGSLAAGTVGVAYSATLTATGGTPPYAWTYTGTLPAGITLSSSGALGGTPSAAGSYSFTVTATDSANSTATQDLVLAVAALPPPPTDVYADGYADTYGGTAPGLAVFTTSLPHGTAGVPYTATLAAAGGTPPYTWTLLP